MRFFSGDSGGEGSGGPLDRGGDLAGMMNKFPLNAELLQERMEMKHNIRNISIISHGKSSVADLLTAAEGEGAQPVEEVVTDKVQHCVAKAALTCLFYKMAEELYMVNLIESSGHIDLAAEVMAALRISDGALLVLDCIKGACVEMEALLRHALTERVKPVLVLDNMEHCFLDLQMTGEEAYQALCGVISSVNKIAATYEGTGPSDFQVSPENGTVAFSSGRHGWAFTLCSFAKLYAAKHKNKIKDDKVLEFLWGDHFFDPHTRNWTARRTSRPTCRRGFDFLCYEPIRQILSDCSKETKDGLWGKLDKLEVELKAEDKENLHGEALMKAVMEAWLPANDALLQMAILNLPSPAKAQKDRVDMLYKGPLDDAYAIAMRACDPDGPLMMYVSRMIELNGDGRRFALGRVFSGKVAKGARVRIMSARFVQGKNKGLCTESVEAAFAFHGKKGETLEVEVVPCGNIVAMAGLDRSISKSATITLEDEVHAYPLKMMKFSTSPVVRKTVRCKNLSDLPILVEGLKLLDKSDPLVVCTTDKIGDHTIAGAGKLHLESCLKSLQDDFMDGTEIADGPLVVSYRETVIGSSSGLDDEVIEAFQEECIYPYGNIMRHRAKLLIDEFGWDRELTDKVWCFGPDMVGLNLLLNLSKQSARHLKEIKESVIEGFQLACEKGALTGERMRGICFEILKAELHTDPEQRDRHQIMKMTHDAMHSAQLGAMPRLMEPVYLTQIQNIDLHLVGTAYNLIENRGGRLLESKKCMASTKVHIMAYLPIAVAADFLQLMQKLTSGQTAVQFLRHDWIVVRSDPFERDSAAANVVAKIRELKGISPLSL